MIKKNKFILLTLFFFIFSTYNFNVQKQSFSIVFPIKKILLEDTPSIDTIKLKAELEFLRNTSLFFLKKKKIIGVTNKYDFISSIQLKKNYPNTLKIFISENIPVVTEIDGKNRYYLTNKGKKINYIELKIYENLPVIFGKHRNFSSFFKEVEKSKLKTSKIKAFYYFDIGRWDIVLRDERIIKLPPTNYENILLKINLLLNDPNFLKYHIFDYRIKDQLILQ